MISLENRVVNHRANDDDNLGIWLLLKGGEKQ